MKRPVPLLLAIATAIVMAPVVRALDWIETSAEIRPQPGRDVALATFHFINRAKVTVHMLGVQTSCGCTDATIDPNDVPPGGTGTVEVVFTLSDRQGGEARDTREVRHVFVKSDDATDPTRLTITVDIPGRTKSPPPAGHH